MSARLDLPAPEVLGGLESAPAGPVPGRFACLEGARALAALGVVVTHCGFHSGMVLTGVTGAVVGRLDIGVTVFFLLSGFLLGRPFVGAGSRPDLRRYAVRRVVRLLPAYWLMLTATLLLLRPDGMRGPGDLVWQYGLLQTYGQYRLLPELSHVWSLGTEVAFYAALPLLLVRCRTVPRQLALLAAVGGSSLLFLTLVHGGVMLDPQRAPQWLPGHLLWFALGLALAVLTTTPAGRQSAPGRLLVDLAAAPGTCWALAGLTFWLACTPVAGGRGLVPLTAFEALARESLYGLAALFLLLPLVTGPQDEGLIRAALRSRPAVALGKVSYGIFLWHLLVLQLVEDVLDIEPFTGHFWLMLGGTVPVSVAVATLSWVLVERPMLARADRWLGRTPAGAAARAQPAGSSG